jgi:hypothetical protein
LSERQGFIDALILAAFADGSQPAALGRADGIRSAMTLADMYASRAGAEPIASAGQAARIGLYL